MRRQIELVGAIAIRCRAEIEEAGQASGDAVAHFDLVGGQRVGGGDVQHQCVQQLALRAGVDDMAGIGQHHALGALFLFGEAVAVAQQLPGGGIDCDVAYQLQLHLRGHGQQLPHANQRHARPELIRLLIRLLIFADARAIGGGQGLRESVDALPQMQTLKIPQMRRIQIALQQLCLARLACLVQQHDGGGAQLGGEPRRVLDRLQPEGDLLQRLQRIVLRQLSPAAVWLPPGRTWGGRVWRRID